MKMEMSQERKELLKGVAIASAIAIFVMVELGFQIHKYIKKRKEEND